LSTIPPKSTKHISPQIIGHKKTTTYDVGNLAPGNRQTQTRCGIKRLSL